MENSNPWLEIALEIIVDAWSQEWEQFAIPQVCGFIAQAGRWANDGGCAMEDFEDALRLFMENAAVEENPWLRPYLERAAQRAQEKAKAQAEYMKQVLNGLDFDADGGTKGGNHGAN